MGRPLQELYQLYEADDPDQANQALGRFADLYATGQIPRIPPSRGHHHRMGRTDLGLPHHPTTGIQRTHRRDQQPPPSPTTRRPRVHQLRQLRRPRNPRNMTPHRALAQPKPTFSRSLNKGSAPGQADKTVTAKVAGQLHRSATAHAAGHQPPGPCPPAPEPRPGQKPEPSSIQTPSTRLQRQLLH